LSGRHNVEVPLSRTASLDVVSCCVNRSLVASSATGDRETPPLVAWSATGEVPWEREKEPRQVTRRGFFASRPKVGDQRTSHRHRELNPREPRVALGPRPALACMPCRAPPSSGRVLGQRSSQCTSRGSCRGARRPRLKSAAWRSHTWGPRQSGAHSTRHRSHARGQRRPRVTIRLSGAIGCSPNRP
jgi:hypothetical protein